MKERSEKIIPEQRIETVTATYCDLCGREEAQWDKGRFEFSDIRVEARIGESYPDHSFGVVYEVDICPDCFVHRLIPWLQSQGAKVEQREYTS